MLDFYIFICYIHNINKMKQPPPRTAKEIDDLIGSIKQKTGLTQEEIAMRIGYNRSYISQAKKTDSEKLYSALYKEFKSELENLTLEEPHIDYSQPIVQVVLNLSYQGKKNADSIDKMASSNLLNARSIATLVNLLASNSDLPAALSALREGQDMPDDLPAEAFLGSKGNDALKRQQQSGRKKEGGR